MRILWGILVATTLFALPAHADQLIDYTLTVDNSAIGDFSWTIQTDGFIVPFFECIAYCDVSNHRVIVSECTEDCGVDYNLFTSLIAVLEPSNGAGCQITGAWLYSFNYGGQPATAFSSPFCDGENGAIVECGIPTGGYGTAGSPPGVTGTWSWQVQNPNVILNPDGTEDFTESEVTLTISDASSPRNSRVPEPSTWALLGFGLLSVFIPMKLRTLRHGTWGLAA